MAALVATMLRRLGAVLALALVPACAADVLVEDGRNPAVVTALDRAYDDAAAETGVPADLLRAVGYVETRWQMVTAEEEHDGAMPSVGLMGLRHGVADRGATLAGVGRDDLAVDPEANIRAAAFLLAEEARVQGVSGQRPARVAVGGRCLERHRGRRGPHPLRAGRRLRRAAQWRRGVRRGRRAGRPPAGPPRAARLDGGARRRLERRHRRLSRRDLAAVAELQRAPARHRRRAWSSSTPARAATPAAGAGCQELGLRRQRPLRRQGGRLRDHAARARSPEGVAHRRDLQAARSTAARSATSNGQSSNNFTVGIEHAGFGSQTSWSAGADRRRRPKLVCDITKRHNIPRDRTTSSGTASSSRTTASTRARTGRGPTTSIASAPTATTAAVAGGHPAPAGHPDHRRHQQRQQQRRRRQDRADRHLDLDQLDARLLRQRLLARRHRRRPRRPRRSGSTSAPRRAARSTPGGPPAPTASPTPRSSPSTPPAPRSAAPPRTRQTGGSQWNALGT